jgi:hypothetical protein
MNNKTKNTFEVENIDESILEIPEVCPIILREFRERLKPSKPFIYCREKMENENHRLEKIMREKK